MKTLIELRRIAPQDTPAVADIEGVQLNPPPRPRFYISYENELIWSQ